jgi:ketosteroid isomerase-like protein
MSQENVEIVRRAYDAWNREDLDAFLSVVDPDAEWGGEGADDLFLGFKTVYHRHAGVRDWWNAAKEPWQYFKSNVQRILAGGDKVVTVVRFEAVGKESGAKIELPFLTNVIELKDGLIVKFNFYYSLEGLQRRGMTCRSRPLTSLAGPTRSSTAGTSNVLSSFGILTVSTGLRWREESREAAVSIAVTTASAAGGAIWRKRGVSGAPRFTRSVTWDISGRLSSVSFVLRDGILLLVTPVCH